jgi:hypothetical protein
MDTTIEYLLYSYIVEVRKFRKNSGNMKIEKKQNYRYSLSRDLPCVVIVLIGPESVSGSLLTT